MKKTKLTDKIFVWSFWIMISMCIIGLILLLLLINTILYSDIWNLIETYGLYYDLIIVILFVLMIVTDL